MKKGGVTDINGFILISDAKKKNYSTNIAKKKTLGNTKIAKINNEFTQTSSKPNSQEIDGYNLVHPGDSVLNTEGEETSNYDDDAQLEYEDDFEQYISDFEDESLSLELKNNQNEFVRETEKSKNSEHEVQKEDSSFFEDFHLDRQPKKGVDGRAETYVENPNSDASKIERIIPNVITMTENTISTSTIYSEEILFQKSCQTIRSNIPEETQSESIEVSSKSTQFPSIIDNSENNNTSIEKLSKFDLDKNGTLKNLAENESWTEDPNFPLSDGYLVVKFPDEKFRNSNVDNFYCNHNTHSALLVASDNNRSESIICFWRALTESKTSAQKFNSYSSVSSCCITNYGFIITGHNDGSISVWDTFSDLDKENLKPPSYYAAKFLSNEGHTSPVIGIHDLCGKNPDDAQKNQFLVCSVEQEACILVWTLKKYFRISKDIACSPSSFVTLHMNYKIDLAAPSDRITNSIFYLKKSVLLGRGLLICDEAGHFGFKNIYEANAPCKWYQQGHDSSVEKSGLFSIQFLEVNPYADSLFAVARSDKKILLYKSAIFHSPICHYLSHNAIASMKWISCLSLAILTSSNRLEILIINENQNEMKLWYSYTFSSSTIHSVQAFNGEKSSTHLIFNCEEGLIIHKLKKMI